MDTIRPIALIGDGKVTNEQLEILMGSLMTIADIVEAPILEDLYFSNLFKSVNPCYRKEVIDPIHRSFFSGESIELDAPRVLDSITNGSQYAILLTANSLYDSRYNNNPPVLSATHDGLSSVISLYGLDEIIEFSMEQLVDTIALKEFKTLFSSVGSYHQILDRIDRHHTNNCVAGPIRNMDELVKSTMKRNVPSTIGSSPYCRECTDELKYYFINKEDISVSTSNTMH